MQKLHTWKWAERTGARWYGNGLLWETNLWSNWNLLLYQLLLWQLYLQQSQVLAAEQSWMGSPCPRSSCWFHFASCLLFLLLVLALAEWASSPGTAVGTQLSLEWEPTWEPLRKQQLLQEPLRATAHIALQQCLLNGELCSKLTSQGWKKSFWCTSLQEDSTKQLQSNSSKYYLTSYYRAYSFMHHMQHCCVPVLFMWIAELGKGSSGQKITGCDVCAGTPYSKLLLVNKWDFSFLCIKYTEARKCHYSAMWTCRWLF